MEVARRPERTHRRRGPGSGCVLATLLTGAAISLTCLLWAFYPRSLTAPSPSGRFSARVVYNGLSVEDIRVTDLGLRKTYSVGHTEFAFFDSWYEDRRLVWDPHERGFVYLHDFVTTDCGNEGTDAQAYEVLSAPPFARAAPTDRLGWARALLDRQGIKANLIEPRP
jgi:hypothetical protein